MSDSELTVFSELAVEQLVTRLQTADSPNQFYEDIVAAQSEENLLHVEWAFRTELPTLVVGKAPHSEAFNAKAIFEYLGPMTPAMAADHRLWTYLSLVTFADFTSERWPLDKRTWERRARDRWVVRTGTRGELVRNAIARLWWATNSTYDPNLSRKLSFESGDPYAYLSVLLAKEDLFLAIMDRDAGMIPNVVFAVLDHLNEIGEEASEDYIRELLKEVTLVSGYSELSSVSSTAVERRINSLSERILSP